MLIFSHEMTDGNALTIIRHYINYYLPREILGPVVIVFSAENVVDRLFSWYVPPNQEFIGWCIVLVLSILIIGYWGEADEDKDAFEQDMDKIENGK